MQIRPALPDELDAVGELTVTAYAEFPGHDADGYAARLRDAATRAREAVVWVALDEGELLGTVTTCPDDSPWRELAHADEGEFRMLAVAPTARGRGVGDALVAWVLELSRREGRRAVVLSSLPEMVAAHRVYARHGFVRDPERDWSPATGVDLVAYRCPL